MNTSAPGPHAKGHNCPISKGWALVFGCAYVSLVHRPSQSYIISIPFHTFSTSLAHTQPTNSLPGRSFCPAAMARLCILAALVACICIATANAAGTYEVLQDTSEYALPTWGGWTDGAADHVMQKSLILGLLSAAWQLQRTISCISIVLAAPAQAAKTGFTPAAATVAVTLLLPSPLLALYPTQATRSSSPFQTSGTSQCQPPSQQTRARLCQ